MNTKQTRWEQKSGLEKLALWCTDRPRAYVTALARMALWLAHGVRVDEYAPTRREVLRIIWDTEISRSDFRMGRWKTIDEIIREVST